MVPKGGLARLSLGDHAIGRPAARPPDGLRKGALFLSTRSARGQTKMIVTRRMVP